MICFQILAGRKFRESALSTALHIAASNISALQQMAAHIPKVFSGSSECRGVCVCVRVCVAHLSADVCVCVYARRWQGAAEWPYLCFRWSPEFLWPLTCLDYGTNLPRSYGHPQSDQLKCVTHWGGLTERNLDSWGLGKVGRMKSFLVFSDTWKEDLIKVQNVSLFRNRIIAGVIR